MAMECELRNMKKLITPEEYELKTLYIGGGTPSFVKPMLFRNILENIFSDFPVCKEFEFTVECNPDSLDEDFLIFFTSYGMNRISIGVQSVSDRILKAINRIHSIGEFMKKYELARKYLENISLDFIVGLPESDCDNVNSTLDLIRKTSPEHLSFYLLELHEETVLFKMYDNDTLSVPGVDTNVENLERISHGLKESGYTRYEISNFARRGYESKHNLTYWNNGIYYGIGASAGGHFKNIRYVNTPNIKEYIESISSSPKYGYREANTVEKELKEHFFMGLRKVDGISIPEIEGIYGKSNVEIFTEKISSREEILLRDGIMKIKDFYLTRNTGIFEFISNL